MLTHLSLFTGIGGLDLAAEWAGFMTVGQCEFADYPTKVLEKHWPDVPRWRDIRTLTGDSFHERIGLRTVDVISGGFPCQPFSTAGKRRGKEDDRYLWPEMLRVIQEIRPAWVVGENVAGIINLALDTVLSDLENIGYACQTVIIPACGVNAPHRRYRCAIIAYNDKIRCELRESERERIYRDKTFHEIYSGSGSSAHTNCKRRERFNVPGVSKRERQHTREDPEYVADTQRVRLREDCNQSSFDKEWDDQAHREKREAELCTSGRGGSFIPNIQGECRDRPEKCSESSGRERPAIGNWWDVEPNVGRVANGIPHRVDRLRCLGNAVVPQQFYPIFKAIYDIEGGIEDAKQKEPAPDQRVVTAQTAGNLERLALYEGTNTGRVIDKLVRDRMVMLHGTREHG